MSDFSAAFDPTAFSSGIYVEGGTGLSYVGAEDVLVSDWLLATLQANSVVANLCIHTDGTVKVFPDLAPAFGGNGDQYGYPFVVFQQQSTTDVFGMGPKARVMISANYIVRAITEGTWDHLVPIAAAIDATLDGASADLSNGTVLGCRRLQQYRMPELHENRIIRHLGGVYSVFAQAR
jgi:hypothetical protein